jgi:hypothetical protein
MSVKSSSDAISKEYFLYFQMASVGETDKHVMFSSKALVGRVFNLQVNAVLLCSNTSARHSHIFQS